MVKTSGKSLRGFLGSNLQSVFYFEEASLGGRCLLLQALPAVVVEGRKNWNRRPSGDDTRLLCRRVLVFAACGEAAVNNLQRIYQHIRHTQAHTHTPTLFTLWPHVALQLLLFIPPMRFLSSCVWFVSVCSSIFIVALHCF